MANDGKKMPKSISMTELPILYDFQAIIVDVKGIGQYQFYRPSSSGEEIFDQIVSANDTHNLLSIQTASGYVGCRHFPSIVLFNFVSHDDERARTLSDDDILKLARWLRVK